MCFAMSRDRDTKVDKRTSPVVFAAVGASEGNDLMMLLEVWMIQ